MELQVSKEIGAMSQIRNASTSKDNVTVCTNPATGEVLAEYRLDTVDDVMNAVKKARIAPLVALFGRECRTPGNRAVA